MRDIRGVTSADPRSVGAIALTGVIWHNSPMATCPFCAIPSERILLANDCALALLDGHPLSEGHTLVVPRAHLASVFELPPAGQQALWALVAQVRQRLLRAGADAINVGINDGVAAGQTVMHGHVHLVPRRQGDVPDPRGGIRWIFPDKAPYWEQA